MGPKIGVEDNLRPVKKYLSRKGYEVCSIKEDTLESFDAVVISGMSENFLGMQDTETGAPIIDATGLTPEEVYDRIRDGLKRK